MGKEVCRSEWGRGLCFYVNLVCHFLEQMTGIWAWRFIGTGATEMVFILNIVICFTSSWIVHCKDLEILKFQSLPQEVLSIILTEVSKNL